MPAVRAANAHSGDCDRPFPSQGIIPSYPTIIATCCQNRKGNSYAWRACGKPPLLRADSSPILAAMKEKAASGAAERGAAARVQAGIVGAS
jgi:hypothetical protein